METRAKVGLQDVRPSTQAALASRDQDASGAFRLTGKLDILVLAVLLVIAFWPILVGI